MRGVEIGSPSTRLLFSRQLILALYGLTYAPYRDVCSLDDYIARVSTPSTAYHGRVVLDLATPNREPLHVGNQILLRGLGRIDGYAGLEPARRLDYRQLAALRVAGVDAVSTDAAIEQGSSSSLAQLRPLSREWLNVEATMPRARLLRAVYATDDPAHDITHLDTEHVALVDVADRARVKQHLGHSSNEASSVGWTKIMVDRPGYIVVESHVLAPAILALTESYHRGWTARAGETQLAAIRVNGDFLGCLLPTGNVHVEFSFEPDSLRYGRLISVCGLGFLVIVLAASGWSRFYCPQGMRMQYDLYEFQDNCCERPPLADSLISIVLPVYNEAAVIRTLVEELTRVIANCSTNAEIIFVNDGSSDGTAELLDQLAAERHDIRVVHFSRNFGHQAAVHAGLAHASGDALVLMDSDMQDAPEAIERFLAKWQEGYDVVYAIRVRRKERLAEAVHFCSVPSIAGGCGNHAHSSRRRKLWTNRRPHRKAHPGVDRARSLFARFRSWVGFRQTGVEVERNARYDAHPRVSVSGLWRLAKTAIFSFSTLPLSIFYTIGYAALGLFLALTVACVYVRLFTDLAIPGWTSYILSASFFGALNALGIGMLGEYVVRIYDQVRGRPLYLVDRVVEHNRDLIAPPTVKDVDQWDDTYRELLEESSTLLNMVRAGRSAVDFSEDENSAELLKLAVTETGQPDKV